jgi:hypothetical protein
MDGLDATGSCIFHLHCVDAGGHDAVGAEVTHRFAQRFFADGDHTRRPLVYWLAVSSVCQSGLRWLAWFSLEAEPSVWISFVLSMALLVLIMRKA